MQELINHLLNSPAASSWQKVGITTHHGINIPLSAIHSKNSCGIGEFYDLLPLIDWCQKLKMDVIQLLPLNNSENDPSPYNASSSCALNFLNLSLHELPFLDKLPALKEKLKATTSLPKPSRINFSQVKNDKLTWLKAYFHAVGNKLVKSKGMQDFISENPWVETYALYESLKDHFGHSPWSSWPAPLQPPTDKQYKILVKQHWPKIAFSITLQYLCYLQLTAVKTYANAHGVWLMGDIPILLSRESADVWKEPELFDIHLEAGAPPDMYNPDGQCWGFPTYRWDVLRKKHFSWWKQRLHYASHFYDIYRLDHVVGFFRIWSVPHGRPSKDGNFIPREESLWELQGRELLNMLISSSPMLPIAEDLGTVPPIVRPILNELGICGTKVMRWERAWTEDGRYIPIQYYPPISLTCVSTHDSDTLELWWKNADEEPKKFAEFKHWQYTPTLTAFQRKEILWDSHHTSSLFHINLLQEYLALFPELVSSNPEDERINVPGKLLATNWTYRYLPSVEEIASHEGLFHLMQKILYAPDPLSL